ncbi:MAG: MaoC family dehydratase N-terminal domain-containing protein [Candidatus Dormiibacterota bacterium]
MTREIADPGAGVSGAVLRAIRAHIGVEQDLGEVTVEAGHVRRFCAAIGDDNPRWLAEAPPTFAVALVEDLVDLPDALRFGTGWLNGGDRFEYGEPIRIGDRLHARRRLVDAEIKHGRTGDLLLMTVETRLIRVEDGADCVRQLGTRIRR